MSDTDYSSDNDFTTPPSVPKRPPQQGMFWLLGAAIFTIVLWQIPWGYYILYPFTILATWFHEMGHGLTALILGGQFEKLMLYPNGSGVAMHSGNLFLGNLGSALVAAGGPLGPPLAGAFFIILGRYYTGARIGLLLLALSLLFSALIWVRSPFGLIATGLIGAAVLIIALKTSHAVQHFAIQFLGVQACISSYKQINYLLTYSVTIDGQNMLSDTGQIAENLFLPFWFWGGLMAAGSLVLLLVSLRIAYR